MVTAIISENTTKLVIYKDGAFNEVSGTAFQIVKKYDDNTLFATDDGNIHKIELDNSFTKSQLHDATGASLGCNFFDLNSEYLVKAFSGTGIVYQKNTNGYTTNTANNFSADGNYPVALNCNNEIFYVNNAELRKRTALDQSTYAGKLLVAGTTPTRMIADEQYLYYIINNTNKIYKIDHTIDNPSPQELTINQIDKDFYLGNPTAPKGISFRGNNLLISSENTVQEYKLDNNQLTFTGFAIASDKTAYNRIGKSASDVYKCGSTVAALDDFKLTVFTNENGADRYARENYKNYLLTSFTAYLPKKLALGKSKVLLSDANHSLKLLDYTVDPTEDGFLTDVSSPSNSIINGLTYQSGVFYVIAYNGTNTDVYSLNESDGSYSLNLVKTENGYDATSIAVDVYGNVILSSGTNVIKLDKANGYATSILSDGLTNVRKIQTDLGGGIFVLDGSQLKYLVNDSFIAININAPSQAIKSFAMDFIDGNVYFIYDNAEYVGLSVNISNIALDDLKVTADYKITDVKASDSLKTVKAKDGANVYSVSVNGESLIFNGLIPSGNKYLHVCELEHVEKHASVKLHALAGADGIVLIDKTQANVSSLETSKSAENKAFVTTDVCGYFLPIITENGEYALTQNTAQVRIKKGTEILPLKTLSFLDNEFYYAEFSVGEVKTFGYVPKAFTVAVLSEDFTWNNYQIERVNATEFFSDSSLKTLHQIKPSLENGEKIRIISTENDVCKILVSDGNGGYLEGYISAKDIKNEPNTAVRNILIILAVSACVCGTTAYFVIKKKEL